jgi:hypothetical protein
MLFAALLCSFLQMPPLHDIHPMRAIFMVTKNPPPKLDDETGYSAYFLEFISACLVKDHTERPEATQLLKTHPLMVEAAAEKPGKAFSTGCVPKVGSRSPADVITDLVASSMGAITMMREDQEAADGAPESQQSLARRTGGQNLFGQGAGAGEDDTGTLVVTGDMQGIYSSQQPLQSQNAPRAIDVSVGRIIDNSTGTLVVGGAVDAIDAGDSGTLVMTPGGGARPSYMDYIRDDTARATPSATAVAPTAPTPTNISLGSSPGAEDSDDAASPTNLAGEAQVSGGAQLSALDKQNQEVKHTGLSGVLEKKGAARWTKKDCTWRPEAREMVYAPQGGDKVRLTWQPTGRS